MLSPLPINTWLPHDRSAEAPIPADLPVLCRVAGGKLIARYSDMVLWQYVTAYLIEETPESAAADLAAVPPVLTCINPGALLDADPAMSAVDYQALVDARYPEWRAA